jgi:Uma2 family endonuclease
MSTFSVRPLIEATDHLLTAADLAALPSQLPSGPVSYELDNGRIVQMSPPANRHGRCQAILARELGVQGELAGHGLAYGEVGVILWRNPDRVVGIDCGFATTASLPISESPEGYLEKVPDLVVEIRSKNDRRAYVDRKVADYLSAGAKLVLVVDPQSETIACHRSGTAPLTLSKPDELTLDDIIPGFRLPLASLV